MPQVSDIDIITHFALPLSLSHSPLKMLNNLGFQQEVKPSVTKDFTANKESGRSVGRAEDLRQGINKKTTGWNLQGGRSRCDSPFVCMKPQRDRVSPPFRFSCPGAGITPCCRWVSRFSSNLNGKVSYLYCWICSSIGGIIAFKAIATV